MLHSQICPVDMWSRVMLEHCLFKLDKTLILPASATNTLFPDLSKRTACAKTDTKLQHTDTQNLLKLPFIYLIKSGTIRFAILLTLSARDLNLSTETSR